MKAPKKLQTEKEKAEKRREYARRYYEKKKKKMVVRQARLVQVAIPPAATGIQLHNVTEFVANQIVYIQDKIVDRMLSLLPHEVMLTINRDPEFQGLKDLRDVLQTYARGNRTQISTLNLTTEKMAAAELK